MKISVRQDAKGIWFCRPYLGKDVFGKPIKPYKRFTSARSKEEAQRLAQMWVSSLTADGRVKSTRLIDLLNDYIDSKSRNGSSPNSVKSYRLFTNNYVARYLNSKFVNEISVIDINRFEQTLLTPKENGGQGLSRNSVLAVHHFLRGAFNYFVDAGICEFNPMIYAAKPHPERKESVSLDEWDFVTLDKALSNLFCKGSSIKDKTYAFAAWLDLRTGLRCGEMCALRRRDINRIAMYIHVGGNVVEEPGKKPYRREVTKGRKCRNVSFTKNELEEIDRFIAWQNETIKNLKADSPLVTLDGSFERPSRVSESFSDLRKRLQLPRKLTFHGLRHTHATWCLMNGVDLKTLSERLGHADEATTLRIYAHVLPGRDAAAAQAFADAANRANSN